MSAVPLPHSLTLVVGPPDQWVVFVAGFEPAHFENKRYGENRQELEWFFEGLGVPKSGSVWDDFIRTLQAADPEGAEEIEGKAKGKGKVKGAGEQPEAEAPPEVKSWLKDPHLLYLLKEVAAARQSDHFLIGEDENILTLYLWVIGKESGEVAGASAAGKNTLVDHTLKLVPDSWYTKIEGLTDKSLRYLPRSIRILYITERRGLRTGEESTPEYDMKVSISEGHFKFLATTKNDAGNFESVLKESLIEQFITTSTEVEAPPELENRLNRISIRDDEPQNEQVRNEQLRKASMPSWSKADHADTQRIAQGVSAQIDHEAAAISVIVPFSDALKPLLRIEETAVRRNTPKLLDLIKASTKVHFAQRAKLLGPTEGAYDLVATPQDLHIVLKVAHRSLEQTLTVLTEKPRRVYELAQELVKQKLEITTATLLGAAKEKKIGGMSRRTVQDIVKGLENKGILGKLSGEDNEYVKGARGAYVYEVRTAPELLSINAEAITAEAVKLYTGFCEANGLDVGPLEVADPLTGALSPLRTSVQVLTDVETGAGERGASDFGAARRIAPDSSPDTGAQRQREGEGKAEGGPQP